MSPMRSRKIEETFLADSNARKDHRTESKSSYGTIEEQSLYSSKEDSSNGDIDNEVLECRHEERGLECRHEERGLEFLEERKSEQCKEESEEESEEEYEEESEEEYEEEYEAYRRSEHGTIGTQMVSETTASNITGDISPLPSEDGTLEEGSNGTLDLPHFNALKGKPQGQDVILDTPFVSSITEMSLIFAEVIDWKRRKIAERVQSHEVGHMCNLECQA